MIYTHVSYDVTTNNNRALISAVLIIVVAVHIAESYICCMPILNVQPHDDAYFQVVSC
jgi:hypothetical protein